MEGDHSCGRIKARDEDGYLKVVVVDLTYAYVVDIFADLHLGPALTCSLPFARCAGDKGGWSFLVSWLSPIAS